MKNSDMDIDIEDNGDGTFSIYYTVKDAGEYTLSIKFGGQPVPEGVYTFTVSLHKVLPVIRWFDLDSTRTSYFWSPVLVGRRETFRSLRNNPMKCPF